MWKLDITFMSSLYLAFPVRFMAQAFFVKVNSFPEVDSRPALLVSQFGEVRTVSASATL